MHLTDDDIVRSISAHSPEGIEALYDRYGGLAHTVALRILSDRGAAEDVVQESFLSVWRRGSTFQPGRGSLRSWICTIVRNRAIDRLRGDRHRTRLDTPMEGQSIEPAITDPWAAVALELSGEEVLGARLQCLPATGFIASRTLRGVVLPGPAGKAPRFRRSARSPAGRV